MSDLRTETKQSRLDITSFVLLKKYIFPTSSCHAVGGSLGPWFEHFSRRERLALRRARAFICS